MPPMLAVAKSKKGGFIGRVRNSSFELRGPGTQGCSFGTGLRGADQKKKSSIGTNVFAGPGEPLKRQRNYDSNKKHNGGIQSIHSVALSRAVRVDYHDFEKNLKMAAVVYD